MALHHPAFRRQAAACRGRARAPRRGQRPRHPYRRPHGAHAQLRPALSRAVLRGVQPVRQDLQPRRSLGARARSAGKPLRHRRALGCRRRRPHAGDAENREARGEEGRDAQFPAEGRRRDQDQRQPRRRLHEDGARPARPRGACIRRLQCRPLARAPVARREAARRRDLRGNDSLRRDARLREEGDGQLRVLFRGADQIGHADQGAPRHRAGARGRRTARGDDPEAAANTP